MVVVACADAIPYDCGCSGVLQLLGVGVLAVDQFTLVLFCIDCGTGLIVLGCNTFAGESVVNELKVLSGVTVLDAMAGCIAIVDARV